MRTPEKLLYRGNVVAVLSEFNYATPWASARAQFEDKVMSNKLASVTTVMVYGEKLEAMELSESEENSLWEANLVELGITHDDLEMDADERWSVICNDSTIDEVRAIRYYADGLIEWRA